jgi:hypothetical protein
VIELWVKHAFVDVVLEDKLAEQHLSVTAQRRRGSACACWTLKGNKAISRALKHATPYYPDLYLCWIASMRFCFFRSAAVDCVCVCVCVSSIYAHVCVCVRFASYLWVDPEPFPGRYFHA